MTEYHSVSGPLPYIPDDLTVAQFTLDAHHPGRPGRPDGSAWIIEDATGRKIHLEELRTRTFGLANALKSKYGIQEDDVVLIFSSNHVDYPVAIWATHRLGAIVSGANPSYTVDELVYQLEVARAKLLITAFDALDTALATAQKAGLARDRIVLMDAPPSARVPFPTLGELIADGLARPPAFTERKLRKGEARTKLAFLNFSSGTTGKPKAVAIPHISPIANVIQMGKHHRVDEDYTSWEERRFRPGDVCIAVLPFYHIYGLVVNLHWILFSGLSVVVVPKFNFTEMLESIVRHRITHLMLVPPQAVLLVKHPAVKKYDLTHVRFLMSGAAPLTAEVNQQLMKVLPNAGITQGYGLTETCTTVCMSPIESKHGVFGSCGRLMPGVTARVVKEDGSLAGVGELGELVVKTPSATPGYANNAEATKETFIDGWVRTGDEVLFDAHGDMFVIDRLKEIMKVRGFQVAPAELEGCLLDHADVADACVVGVPDDFSGEVPLAFVVLSADAAARAAKGPEEVGRIKAGLAKFVADNKTAYKRLAGGVEIVDAIPKNPSGKLLRRVLRQKALEMRGKGKPVAAKAKL